MRSLTLYVVAEYHDKSIVLISLEGYFPFQQGMFSDKWVHIRRLWKPGSRNTMATLCVCKMVVQPVTCLLRKRYAVVNIKTRPAIKVELCLKEMRGRETRIGGGTFEQFLLTNA
jgi:hypothetical protein